MSSGTSSYWCYRCNRFVRVRRQDMVVCPDCDSGFVEEIEHTPRPARVDSRRRRFPTAAMYMIGNHHTGSDPNNLRPALRRSRRNGGDHNSHFNPVIVLRGSQNRSGQETGGGEGEGRGFELYYDDGAGSGLRPLPPNMSEMLLGSGFDRLLEQLSQIEMNGIARYEQPPASKAAIDSLPTVEICENHLASESHCAICMEPFELATSAREMPCKHMYHSNCILPWLAIRNSCPVCRHELPTDHTHNNNAAAAGGGGVVDEDNVGLTIWRLPGGGFAVGRFAAGGRRSSGPPSDHREELPVVYTEMDGDGGFGNGEPRRVRWSSSREDRGGRESGGGSGGGGLRRMFRNLFSCFACAPDRAQSTSSTSSTSYSTDQPRPLRRNTSRSRPNMNASLRSRRTWSMEGNSGMRSW